MLFHTVIGFNKTGYKWNLEDADNKSIIRKIERHYLAYNFGDKATKDYEIQTKKSMDFSSVSSPDSLASDSSRFSKPPSNIFEVAGLLPDRRYKIHGRKLESLFEEIKSRGLEWDPKSFEAKMAGQAAFYAGLTLLGKIGFMVSSIIPSFDGGEAGEFDISDDLPDCFDSLFDWQKLFGGD